MIVQLTEPLLFSYLASLIRSLIAAYTSHGATALQFATVAPLRGQASSDPQPKDLHGQGRIAENHSMPQPLSEHGRHGLIDRSSQAE